MNKIIVSSLVAVVALGANIASAQSYYPTYSYGSNYAGGCVNLSGDLSYGSRGSDVRSLQSFLIAQNYPGGGSWMLTGYYGQATTVAVRNFQQLQNLAMTGAVDAATRAAIARASCGGSFYNYNNNYSAPVQNYVGTPYTNPYNYNTYLPTQTGNTGYTGTVALTSLSQNTGAPGASVTVYGVGFDYANNTIYFGSQALSGISSNGTSLTFTIPYTYTASGNVQFYVTNSRGTSNSLTFTVMSYGYGYNSGCGTYPYNTYNYGYTNCYQPPVNNYSAPAITYLSPTSGAVGTSVTVYGSGFTRTGNAVHFGPGIIANLSSLDGSSVSFTVPTSLTGFGAQVMTLSTYNVSVTNSSGFTSNAVPFTVTSLGSYIAPTITSLNGPTSLSAGVSGTWTITLNNPGNSNVTTSVRWGDETLYPQSYGASQSTYMQGTNTLTFTHTYYGAGTYTPVFTVSNSSGQQNSSSMTVVVSGQNSGNVSLSYLSPTSGRVGTQVTLQGSGFSALDNTVHFGMGGTLHVPSQNGTTIYYTIPYGISPCDLAGFGCSAPSTSVSAGAYPVYVTNSQGTTNTQMFQVQ